MQQGRNLALLLDIDGTLVFTDHLYRKVFQRLLTPLGYDVTDEFYHKNVHGKVDADVFGKLMPAGSTPEELLAMSKRKDSCFCELYNEATAEAGEPPMLRGLPEALSMAQRLGLRAIAVTNAQRGAGEAAIASLRAHIPAASIIEGLVIGAECACAKPAPDPYLEGMRQLGVTADECLVFEDSRSGIKSGVAAGVLGVIGLRSTLSDEQLRETGCVATMADWSEFTPDFVAGFQRGEAPMAAPPPSFPSSPSPEAE